MTNNNFPKNRGGFQVKNFNEKEAYKNFLKENLAVHERTEERDEDVKKTNSSTFEKDEDELKKESKNTEKFKKKSFLLKLLDGDFWKNAIVKTVFAGVVLAVILGYFTLWSDLKTQDEKISNTRKDMDSTILKYDSYQKDFNTLNLDFNTFKVSVLKDFEFIKNKLN